MVAHIQKCNKRDKTFYNYIENHKDMVYQVCFMILGNALIAEKISTSVFQLAYINLSYEGSTIVQRDWLHKEIICQIFHYFEQEKISMNHPVEINEGNISSLSNDKLSKEEQLLRNSLLSLPLTDRTFIVLRNICGLSAKEVYVIIDQALKERFPIHTNETS